MEAYLHALALSNANFRQLCKCCISIVFTKDCVTNANYKNISYGRGDHDSLKFQKDMMQAESLTPTLAAGK